MREGTQITVQESDGNNDKILTWNTTATSIANQTVTVSLNNSSVTWDYSVNNNNFEVTRNGNVLTIKPQSTAQESHAELTIFTSDGAEAEVKLQVIERPTNITVKKTLNIKRLSSMGGYTNVDDNLAITSSNNNVTIDSYVSKGSGNWEIQVTYVNGNSATLTFTYDGYTDRVGTLTLTQFLDENTTSIQLN